ncbi:MAG: hypothetical protein ABL921_19610 [Pirellula sp.]
MPRERYIPPSEEQMQQWEEEKETKRKLDALRSELIQSALRKLKKSQLIDLLMGLDTYDPTPRWSIEATIDVKKPPELIVHDLRQAIEMATQVDRSKLNHNFAFNWQAYEETERGFKALVASGNLEMAKQMAIEFMNKASYQVECSDEGMMTENIEACLKTVIQAVAVQQPHMRHDWATQMLQADRCGFICLRTLEALLESKSS